MQHWAICQALVCEPKAQFKFRTPHFLTFTTLPTTSLRERHGAVSPCLYNVLRGQNHQHLWLCQHTLRQALMAKTTGECCSFLLSFPSRLLTWLLLRGTTAGISLMRLGRRERERERVCKESRESRASRAGRKNRENRERRERGERDGESRECRVQSIEYRVQSIERCANGWSRHIETCRHTHTHNEVSKRMSAEASTSSSCAVLLTWKLATSLSVCLSVCLSVVEVVNPLDGLQTRHCKATGGISKAGVKTDKICKGRILAGVRDIWSVFLEILPLQKSKEKHRKTYEKLRKTIFSLFFLSFSLF